MTNLDEMWTALESHQPIADKRGYGEQWKRMCVERSGITALVAAEAADDAEDYVAAGAAEIAEEAIAAATVADDWAKKAIKYIALPNQTAM